MSEIMVVPWYATTFRDEEFVGALNKVAAVAMQYGASSFEVYRSAEDRARFQQFATFEDHLAWESYWEGPEMIEFRAVHSGMYQVPVLYGIWERTAGASIEEGRPIPRSDEQEEEADEEDASPASGQAGARRMQSV